MGINIFNTYKTSRREMHMRHLGLIALAVVFSWVLWVIVDYPEYSTLHGKELVLELLKQFGEQLVETTILLEISLLYIKGFVRFFWDKEKNLKNLIIQVMILAVLNGFSSVMMGLLYRQLYPAKERIFAQIAFTDYLSLSVLTTAYLVIFLINRYRDEMDAHLESERKLKEEENIRLKAQLKNLSLQTDNHFVFNSLSTLASLIKTSPEDAGAFVVDFSSMYRYLVTNGARDIVSLKDELAFAGDYIELLKYRYSGVSVIIDASLSAIHGYASPAAIEGLIENAVKHNRHGKDDTLRIEIKKDGDNIVVSNNILPIAGESRTTGTGLATLRDRYLMLCGKPVSVVNDGATFTVTLPIMYEEDLKDESIDY